MLIGYMHYRKRPEGLNKAYAFAAVAKAEGAQLLYFSPGAADFEKGIINGWQYSSGEWRHTASRYPDVIYNTNGFVRDKQAKAVERLQQEIPFTSHSIGSKMTVYRNLMEYETYADYLVPSEKILSAEHFFVLLEQYPEAVCKPSSGHQGINISYIKKEGGKFCIRSGTEEVRHSTEEMDAFIRKKLMQDEYIIQPYINSRTKAGVPYDLRLHVQKGHEGKWVSPIIYPRISANGNIVCNIGQGGYTGELTSFLKQEFGEVYYDVQKYVELFSLQLAAHMDQIQKERYGEELNELGIDIGLDSARNIFIYEVNWRPGHPPSINIDLNIIKNTIGYAMYLAKQAKSQTNREVG